MQLSKANSVFLLISLYNKKYIAEKGGEKCLGLLIPGALYVLREIWTEPFSIPACYSMGGVLLFPFNLCVVCCLFSIVCVLGESQRLGFWLLSEQSNPLHEKMLALKMLKRKAFQGHILCPPSPRVLLQGQSLSSTHDSESLVWDFEYIIFLCFNCIVYKTKMVVLIPTNSHWLFFTSIKNSEKHFGLL